MYKGFYRCLTPQEHSMNLEDNIFDERSHVNEEREEIARTATVLLLLKQFINCPKFVVTLNIFLNSSPSFSNLSSLFDKYCSLFFKPCFSALLTCWNDLYSLHVLLISFCIQNIFVFGLLSLFSFFSS